MAPLSKTTNLYPEQVQLHLEKVCDCIDMQMNFENQVGSFIEKADLLNGKMLRPALLLLAAEGTGGVTAEHIKAAASVELIHNASLMHDDVIDQSSKRREDLSVNQRLGNSTAVLLGDLLMTKAFGLLQDIGDGEILPTVTETVSSMCMAELTQNQRLFDFDISESDYLDIIRGKTASLFGLSFKLAALISGCRQNDVETLTSAGLNFGMAYQIIDDCNDIFASGSENLSDIKQGIVTLAFIKLFKDKPACRSEIAGLIENKDFDKISALISSCDTKEYSLNLAKSYIAKSADLLGPILDVTAKSAIISIFKLHMQP